MSSSPGSRALRLSAVAFGFGLLLAFVPTPAVQFSTRSVGATEALPTTEPMPAADQAQAQAQADVPLTGDRVVSTNAEVADFTAIGVTFDRAPDQPVLVRVKDAAGTFGPWKHLDSEDSGPDAGTEESAHSRHSTEPLWVKHASGYEISLAPSDARAAKVATVRDVEHRSVVQAEPLAGAAAPPPFGVNLRSAWGARPATSTSYGSTVKLALVHHSASPNNYSPADVPGWLRSIQAYHMDTNGWSDIAYNFVVDKFGGIWEGRAGGIDRSVIGAHSMGFNTNSVGVMVLGDFTSTAATAASLESVSKVIGWKFAINGVDPNGLVDFTSLGSYKYPAGTTVNLPRVVGHQDTQLTDCPGSIEGNLGSIRARAQDWTNFVRVTSGPIGSIDRVVPGANGLTVIGWVIDLDADGPSDVTVVVDGVQYTARADQNRPDVATQYPTAGPNHGFWVDVGGLSPGWHDVCVVAWNRGYGNNTSLGCTGATVADPAGQSPVGSIDSISVARGRIDLSGRASDPTNPGSIAVTLEVDGQWRRTLATGGDGRFSATLLGVPGGFRKVCGVGINQGAGSTLRFDCKFVSVPEANPRGSADSLTVVNGAIVSSGWAVDDESVDPITVSLVIDGRWNTVWADRRRDDWDRLYPGYGDAHGYAVAVATPKGSHTACVVANNVGGGISSNLANCRTIVVK
jgi:hypothetical protein